MNPAVFTTPAPATAAATRGPARSPAHRAAAGADDGGFEATLDAAAEPTTRDNGGDGRAAAVDARDRSTRRAQRDDDTKADAEAAGPRDRADASAWTTWSWPVSVQEDSPPPADENGGEGGVGQVDGSADAMDDSVEATSDADAALTSSPAAGVPVAGRPGAGLTANPSQDGQQREAAAGTGPAANAVAASGAGESAAPAQTPAPQAAGLAAEPEVAPSTAEDADEVASGPGPAAGRPVAHGAPAPPSASEAGGIDLAAVADPAAAQRSGSVPAAAAHAPAESRGDVQTPEQPTAGPSTNASPAEQAPVGADLAAAAMDSAAQAAPTGEFELSAGEPSVEAPQVLAPERTAGGDVSPTLVVPPWRRADMEAAVQAAQAAATSPAEATQVLDQLVKSLRVQWKQGLGEARILLRPEHLGPVDVSIKVEGGAVTAVVRAESAQVQEWLLSNQQSLRQQLEAAGLRLDDLVVSRDGERRRQQQEPAPDDDAPRRGRARRHDTGQPEPTFSIVV